ncbi:response regulator transcription factor [Streptomyces sp. NPDC055299]
MAIRPLIADDRETADRGVRRIVESRPDMEVAGEAADDVDDVELGRIREPDVALMGIRMPRRDGLKVTRLPAGPTDVTGPAAGPRTRRRDPLLTGREVEIAGQVAEGKTRADIARELFLSAGTVKTHVAGDSHTARASCGRASRGGGGRAALRDRGPSAAPRGPRVPVLLRWRRRVRP